MAQNTHELEAQYIIDESPEVTLGESPYLNKFFSIFPALSSRNYLLYSFGQLISLIGTWLQIVAQGWLVFQLTNSAFWLGVVSALAFLPALLFSLFGGVIVDRFPKKHLLIFTQVSSMILAFILGILTLTHLITVWEIGLLAFLLGMVGALDSPARQSFTTEMVGKERLASAIALNSAFFNSARVLGPAVAGFLIVLVGTGGAFILNGFSYIAVIIALLLMNVPLVVHRHDLKPLAAIKEGISFAYSNITIRMLMVLTAVLAIFGWSYTTIFPIIAEDRYHLGAAGLGYLYAAMGLGALAATIILSAGSKKYAPEKFIFTGSAIFIPAMLLFSLSLNFVLSLFFLFLTGFGLILQIITINSTIQHLVSNEIRGRVMSIYVLMLVGMGPIGNFGIGWLAQRFGVSLALQLFTFVILVFVLLLFSRRHKIFVASKIITTST
jgi:MFS family permease